jgi:hypothetical protein
MNPGRDWQELYMAAVLETDWTKMEERIEAAELAIHARQRVFSEDHGGTPTERQAIADAMSSLSVLRKEAASWSAKIVPFESVY